MRLPLSTSADPSESPSEDYNGQMESTEQNNWLFSIDLPQTRISTQSPPVGLNYCLTLSFEHEKDLQEHKKVDFKPCILNRPFVCYPAQGTRRFHCAHCPPVPCVGEEALLPGGRFRAKAGHWHWALLTCSQNRINTAHYPQRSSTLVCTLFYLNKKNHHPEWLANECGQFF